ncbi:CPBP family intramembrane glutamic endopeptidase [Sandaracinus amylolyticus]|uniref:CAAX prenyl protease 2/Lysostaphin resistance protein A-like domain-containing protein n=1 Tax=Sandaracinus amylolyticus TaxID=927083 RepID=A0A0F6SF55_9BACT|nr:CPBP family intramembrane glutamic endopeptidase [Sandaracinus amylolyticus]AKF06354.1 hypothetical protein DB32_003503 [Sandaracinus amylolyticus]
MSRRRITGALIAYAATIVVALGLGVALGRPMIARHPSAILDLGGAASIVSMGLGLVIAVITITSTRSLLARTRWARALRTELKTLLEGASGAQLVLLGVASGVAEELLFRGALQPWLGYVGTSIGFGLLHVAPRRELLPWTVWAVVMGFVLGGVFELTGALEGPIVAHVLINVVNLRVIARHDARLDPGDGRLEPPKLVSRVRRER